MLYNTQPASTALGTDTDTVAEPQNFNTNDDSSWWRRPAGGREVLTIAMPLVVSMLSVTVMTFVDRMFLNWHSSTAMAAAFSGSIVWWASLCLPMGICSYANTFVSQYFGDGQPKQIGVAMWQGVWVALLATPIMLLFISLAPGIFALASHGEEAAKLETTYMQILCFGTSAMLISTALSSFYGGMGRTWVVMLVDTTVVVVNLVLDYLWIFGYGGFPEMGIAGAAWATSVSLWLKVAIYLWLVLQKKHREEYGTLAGMRFDSPLFRRLIHFGFPSGVQMLLDVLGWTVFVMLVARLGHVENTATTLAFSISSLAFMPIWGFGMAASILVGQKLGEDRDDLAARATQTVLRISLGYMAIISLLYIVAPDLFLTGFFAESPDPQNVQDAIYAMAVNLLCFVAAYNLLDAVMMVYVCALKGAGDTRYIMNVSIVMAIVLAGLSWLVVDVLKSDIYVCWIIVIGWVWVMGGLFFWRYRTGKWRTMRVIETEHEPTLHEEAVTEELPVESPAIATSE